jgi:hypothetical protein
MPKVSWGVGAADIDNFDRESQYAPYDGPIPANGVYQFRVKVLKHAAGAKDKFPQLRVGLELVPRKNRREEKALKGYFLMAFLPISERTQFRYVPFLDAIGVSGREFERGTITDEDGNVKKIGRWRNTGEVIIKAEIKDSSDQNGNSRKDVGWMGAADDDDPEDDDDEYETDGDEDDDDGDDW